MGEIVEKKVTFISGPSDTYEEMQTVKSVIESLNKVFCPPLHLILEVAMGSTHAIAGTGRPQAKINPWVEKCDLFIGVYKKRFGTNTGQFESGSEEEFRIAFERNMKSGGIPEIFLFFQDIPKDELDDIGPQLGKLLEFKKDLRRYLFYKSFSNERELIFTCYEQIIQWLNKFTYNNQDSKESQEVET